MLENNYCIVQTSEHKDTFLSVLPSCWVMKNGWKSFGTDDSNNNIDGVDLCYWPKGVAGYRLLEKSKKDPKIRPDIKLLRAFRCKMKRNKFASYTEAFRELKMMEMNSDTEDNGTLKKMRKVTTAADLFNKIQKSKPEQSRESPNPKAGPSRTSPSPNPKTRLSRESPPPNQSESETEIDMECSRASMLKPTMSEMQFPGSARTPPLNRTSVNESATKTLDLRKLLLSLHEKVDKNSSQIEQCKLVANRSITLLSQVNAKLDVLASQLNMKLDAFAQQKSQYAEPDYIGTMSAPLNPIKTVEELESLEKKTDNKQFVGDVVLYLGSMHGKDRYVNEGGTVCLQIVDFFFDREFLLNCSWTGTSRQKNNNEITVPKIPFHKFDGVITLFHKVVMFSDPSYPLVPCQYFLKRCLRNAKQRFGKTKGIRAPVARKRRKRNTQSVQRRTGVEEGEQVEEEESSMDDDKQIHDEEEEDPLVEYDWRNESDIPVNKAVIVEEYILK